MLRGHSYIAWISTNVGIFNVVLIVLFLVLSTDWVVRLATLFILSGLGLITGVMARYGSEKDNLGVAGIVLAVVAPVICFGVIID